MLLLNRQVGRLPGLLLALMLILCLETLLPRLGGAEVPRRPFAIPAADAEGTLETFSDQAGAQVVYLMEDVRGVTTNLVKGDFAIRDALDRLVVRTGLRVELDGKTGAFVIKRERQALQSAEKSKTLSTTPPQAMKKSLPTRLAAALIAVTTSILSAQTAPASSNNSPTKDETLVLSPFIVNSEKDTGYQATSTLAGTRLNTPLKDIGASISIYTKDFLDDIGATNSGNLLIYATGMEAAGPGGNFSGASNDINAAEVGNEARRADPQQSSRTRGLAAPNFTRGFFASSIAFDSYNTDRVTVSRGPNGLLFGVGSPAGVVDTSLIRPDLQRNKNKIVMRYGNNDSLRGSVVFNRVLIDRKLALRIAALHDKEEYNQRPAFEEKKRLYGAVTFEPYKSSSVRANFEWGSTRANRPITVLPVNNIPDQWYAAGRPGYDWSFYDDPARNPNAQAEVAGSAFFGPLMSGGNTGGKITTVFSNPSDRTPAFGFLNVTPSTSGNGANAVKNQVFNPLVNRDLAADSIGFIGTNNIFEFPGAFWTGANVLPGQLAGLPPAGIKYQAFTDFSAFDFKNRMIDEMSRQGDTFHAFNIAFEQRAWKDRVGIELAYDTQRIVHIVFTAA